MVTQILEDSPACPSSSVRPPGRKSRKGGPKDAGYRAEALEKLEFQLAMFQSMPFSLPSGFKGKLKAPSGELRQLLPPPSASHRQGQERLSTRLEPRSEVCGSPLRNSEGSATPLLRITTAKRVRRRRSPGMVWTGRRRLSGPGLDLGSPRRPRDGLSIDRRAGAAGWEAWPGSLSRAAWCCLHGVQAGG